MSHAEKGNGIENFEIYQLERRNIQSDDEPTLEMLDDYVNREITLLEKANVMDNEARIEHIKMRNKENKSVQLHMYLHRTVKFHFNKRLTKSQLLCFLDYFEDCKLNYTGEWLMQQKAAFLEYLDINAPDHYNVEDMESLRKLIIPLSDVEFNVIADFFVEQWNTGVDIERLSKELVEFY
jgi:hypothetical protein